MASFKLNKRLALVSFDGLVCVAVCHPGLDCLLSGPRFLAQPFSVYITDVPLEALEANVPEHVSMKWEQL